MMSLVKRPKNDEKAQSAVEMLIVYSWAFIIIAVVVSFVFIVSGSSRQPYDYLSPQCNLQPLLPCPETVLNAPSSNSPMEYRALLENELAPAMAFQSNGFIVSTTDIGVSGVNNFTGNCTPAFALKGDEITCVAAIPGSLVPPIGSQVSVVFTISYRICPSFSLSNCPTAIYKSSGYALQSISTSKSNQYQVALSSTPNSIFVINNQRLVTGQNALLNLGTYPIYVSVPSGYAFQKWSSTANITVASPSSINTTATIIGNSTLTANFIAVP